MRQKLSTTAWQPHRPAGFLHFHVYLLFAPASPAFSLTTVMAPCHSRLAAIRTKKMVMAIVLWIVKKRQALRPACKRRHRVWVHELLLAVYHLDKTDVIFLFSPAKE